MVQLGEGTAFVISTSRRVVFGRPSGGTPLPFEPDNWFIANAADRIVLLRRDGGAGEDVLVLLTDRGRKVASWSAAELIGPSATPGIELDPAWVERAWIDDDNRLFGVVVTPRDRSLPSVLVFRSLDAGRPAPVPWSSLVDRVTARTVAAALSHLEEPPIPGDELTRLYGLGRDQRRWTLELALLVPRGGALQVLYAALRDCDLRAKKRVEVAGTLAEQGDPAGFPVLLHALRRADLLTDVQAEGACLEGLRPWGVHNAAADYAPAMLALKDDTRLLELLAQDVSDRRVLGGVALRLLIARDARPEGWQEAVCNHLECYTCRDWDLGFEALLDGDIDAPLACLGPKSVTHIGYANHAILDGLVGSGRRGTEGLVRLLRHPDVEIADAAFYRLIRRPPDGRVFPAVAEALATAEPARRREFLVTLRFARPEGLQLPFELAPILEQLARDPTNEEAEHAIDLLAHVGEAGEASVVAMLREPAFTVPAAKALERRDQAFSRSLDLLGQPDVDPATREALLDWVRVASGSFPAPSRQVRERALDAWRATPRLWARRHLLEVVALGREPGRRELAALLLEFPHNRSPEALEIVQVLQSVYDSRTPPGYERQSEPPRSARSVALWREWARALP